MYHEQSGVLGRHFTRQVVVALVVVVVLMLLFVLYLGKPSFQKSAVFLNIVQKAFDPPPFI